MMKRRVMSILMALVMVLSLLPVGALAADFTDTEGHWGKPAIDRWVDENVVQGNGDGTFNPGGSMTRAEAAQTFANLFRLTGKADISIFPDISLDAWYVDAIAKCVDAGILLGKENGRMDPNGPVTREQLFTMLGRALGVQVEETSKITFTDSSETSDWAAGYINAMVNMGAINGMGNNILAPKDNINRAAVMTVMDRMIGAYITKDGTYAAPETGLILIVGGKKVSITGDIDGDRIVIFDDGVAVDLSGATGVAEITVMADDVVITGAAAGTRVTAAADNNLTVNGTVLDQDKLADGVYTVPGTTATKPGTSSGGSSSSGGTVTKSYTVTFYANYPDSKMEDGDGNCKDETPPTKPEDGDDNTDDPNNNCQGANPDDSTPPEGNCNGEGENTDPDNNCNGDGENTDPDNNCKGDGENTDPDGNCEDGGNTTDPDKGENTDPENPDPENPEKGEEEPYATVTVKSGKTVGADMPANPEAPEGYKFVGWATEKDAQTPDFDGETKVTGNVTVYAIWTEDADNNCGGGEETPDKPEDGKGDTEDPDNNCEDKTPSTKPEEGNGDTEDPDNNCEDETPSTGTEGSESTGGDAGSEGEA